LDRPLEILHVSIGVEEPAIAQPRLSIRVGSGADISVIERYATLGPSLYFNNVVVDVEMRPGASLNHVRVQTESDQAYQVARQTLRQSEESRYSLRSLVVGGAWSRFHLDCRLAGERAEADLKGLYLVNGRRFADQHLKIGHQTPHCQSNEDFRGILNGAGRAVFDGNIVVERGAQKTDARLSNDNLMLSRDAEVDTKPQLEIYADDVKCSHGTTVGELDQNALFYLRSRGIGLDQAKRILCRGFAQDLFDDVQPQVLFRYLIKQIDGRLTEPEET
jgi:Fe-S cluster assembly protein SufD